MDLKIKDVADLLNVSESTIRRWLSDGKIPTYKLNHQYRFSRPEIENWMMDLKVNKETSQKVPFAEKQIYPEPTQDIAEPNNWQPFSLYRALHRGDVIFNTTATSKEALIRETMDQVAPKISADASVITDLLLDREKLMPTALNQGIAVPHTRDFLMKGSDIVVICFPKKPIDWGALDGEPIHTAFFLFASDDKRHLNLLAKLAHLSSNDKMLTYLRSKPPKPQLLSHIKSWESTISS